MCIRDSDKWVEGLFAGREGHEGFNPRDINDQKLMRAINKRTTSMDVDSAGRIGLSESLRKQANLDLSLIHIYLVIVCPVGSTHR